MNQDTNTEEESLLLKAAQCGDLVEVRRLLDAGVPPDARSKQFAHGGQTPLMQALLYGHEDAARVLLEAGASVTAADNDGETVFCYAFGRGDIKALLQLLFDYGLPIEARGDVGQTPLMMAAKENFALSEFLVNLGADIHARDADQRTPLMYACDWIDEETIQLLLDRGANINDRDFRGQTALMMTIYTLEDDYLSLSNEQTPVCYFMAEDGDPAVEQVIIKRLNYLIGRGADIHAVDNRGWSVLLLALACGYPQAAEVLVQYGASLVGLKKESVKRARDFAEHNGFHEVVLMLDALTQS